MADKPTPEQIVDALLRIHVGLPCHKCFYDGKCYDYKKDAADLIRSQAARIRELEAKLEAAEGAAEKAEADANCAKDRLAQAIGEANQAKAEQWHDLTKKPDDLPEEHDTVFAKFYGTDKWNSSMFRTASNSVIAAFCDKTGEIISAEAHTIDGKWKVTRGISILNDLTVIAWMPMPKPQKEGEVNC